MKILALEPYFGLSHRTFFEGYKKYSRHEVEIWSLPPRKWKWRMRGSAYHFAERAAGLPSEARFDALIASDFLNLPDFLALAPRPFRDLPNLVYFHENQITYPLGKFAPIDFHYGWINVSTAFAADRLLFNSQYHREEFLQAVRAVFRRMPDYVPERLVEKILEKSRLFPVGLDGAELDQARQRTSRLPGGPPAILWNHRWEYDKGPETFFEALARLKEEGIAFRLVVCGQPFKNQPPVFHQAREQLADRIDHFGFFPDRQKYLERACQCDLIVSTAVHEFFGVSVSEAIYLGCLPVLPKRLSYPEIIPPHLQPLFLYSDDLKLVEFLKAFLARPPVEYREELRRQVARYDWRHLANELDLEIERLRESHPAP